MTYTLFIEESQISGVWMLNCFIFSFQPLISLMIFWAEVLTFHSLLPVKTSSLQCAISAHPSFRFQRLWCVMAGSRKKKKAKMSLHLAGRVCKLFLSGVTSPPANTDHQGSLRGQGRNADWLLETRALVIGEPSGAFLLQLPSPMWDIWVWSSLSHPPLASITGTHGPMLLDLQLNHTVPCEQFLKALLPLDGLNSGPRCMVWGMGQRSSLSPCITPKPSSPGQGNIVMNVM